MRRGAFVRELLRRPQGLFGVGWLALVVLSALVSLFWTPLDPFETDPYSAWLTPSLAHPFGTDSVGRDIFSYVFAATGTTVVVAVASGVVATVVGVGLAALGSLTSRWVRESVAVLIDVLVAFPTLLIAMALAAAFGGSLTVVVVAVGIGYGVTIARVSRSEIRQVARTDYVLAARANGLGTGAVLRRHLLPNVAPVFVVQLSLSMATSVLAEAGLSFLGYGAPANTASWGRLLSDLQKFIGVHPGSVVWPGLAITLTVLALNLLGDAVRDASDPRLRSRRGGRGRPADGSTPPPAAPPRPVAPGVVS
ncbi:ABC transporter permease [Frigoribacterium sp. PhB24]|uniref:ABC transporter permease n=1 Tax=Frigoribacterium sp. PhB24 TaxID=2485204 RepID=UPI000F4A1F76|nr:ABC transporter permease [Frigoribacterium sp. PhB24]ROS54684.1 peptide/nickel transport system permease protein [Frigoribacterium sp. PhB24]